MSNKRKETLEGALQFVLWTKQLEEKSDFTIRDYRQRIMEFINFLKKEYYIKYVEEVDKSHVRHYIKEMDDRNLSNTTINGKLRYLRSFFNIVIEEELVSEDFVNPLEGISLRKENWNVKKHLSKEDLEKLLEYPDKRTFTGMRNYMCMLLMLGTGIRPSELLALNVDDCKEYHIIVRDEVSKTGEMRILPLSTGLRKELYKYLKIKGDWGGDILFPNYEGKRLSTRGLSDAIKRIAEKAGLDKNSVGAYSFRHTFAINYLREGGDPLKLQKLLGHTTLEMTRRYVRWDVEDLKSDFDQRSIAEQLIKNKKRERRR